MTGEVGSVRASERLKEDTRSIHQGLESLVGPLLFRNLTLNVYVNYLKAVRQLYRLWEPTLTRIGQSDELLKSLEYDKRVKLGIIEEDLRDLGSLESGSRDACYGLCLPEGKSSKNDEIGRIFEEEILETRVPSLESSAHRLGLLYVVEGSVQGGAVIAKRVKQILPETLWQGLRFLQPYGNESERLWNLFKDVLNSYHRDSPEDYSTIVAAARETFAVFLFQVRRIAAAHRPSLSGKESCDSILES